MSKLLNPIMNSYSNDFDIQVMEGYDVEVGGDAAAHQEFVQEMVCVYEAMHAMDMAEIELRKNNGGVALESCTEGLSEYEAVQEASVNSVTTRIKDSLKSLWGKIKGFFKSIRKYFDYLFMNGKDFAKKYQTEIVKAAAKADDSFEFKMYNFNDSKIDDVAGAQLYDKAYAIVTAALQTHQAAINDFDTEAMDKNIYVPYRKFILGSSASGDAENFSKEAFKFFRNGAEDDSDKETVKASQTTAFIKILTSSKADSALDKMEKAMDKSFKDAIKKVENLEKEATDKENTGAIRCASKLATAFSKCQSIASTFVRIWHQAVKDRASAYKQACMKVMTHRNKK